ncbi:MAG: DUF1402 family protein [Bdellovibrionaceae bacterium]|nr:DUF1402 family protein [Pseudobdellovibrionaceae bacterium]
MRVYLLLVTLFFICSANAATFELTVDEYLRNGPVIVPPGNMNNAAKDYSASKYKGVIAIITQEDNICVIKNAARIYEISPIAIMGSIIGEHTYNVGAWDIAQENYLYMWKKWIDRFEDNGLNLADLIQEEKYASCPLVTDNNYDLWGCYNSVWKTDKRNSRKGGKNWEIKWSFFNPLGSGFTYGFGQLGPERALMVTDVVNRYSGFPILTIQDPPALYDAILNPQTSIHYVAATNKVAIEIYKKYANFDISQNPGVIATLYNLGREYEKAEALYERTMKNLTENGKAKYPEVNYYGWLINSEQEELQSIYEKAIKKHNCP